MRLFLIFIQLYRISIANATNFFVDIPFPTGYNDPTEGGGTMIFFTEYTSPLGRLLLTSDGNALTGLWLESQPRPTAEMQRSDDLPLFDSVRSWLDSYFQGIHPKAVFPISPAGTEFQQKVWKLLLRIPYGETTTYGTIAKEIAPNMSAQAIGGAVGRNPISIIIPCHRVVGANGQLTGYAGGLKNKKWLLIHEEETK